MNLRQVKGNTWVLEGLEFIPLYRLDGGRCVLLDTGLAQEREELERLFQERRRYRESIGADRTLAPEALDLCPYHHSRQTSK